MEQYVTSMEQPPTSDAALVAVTHQASGGDSEAVARGKELRTRLASYLDALTPQQQRCAELYVITGNKVQAWREAYGHKGRKNVRDYVSAWEILNKPHVKAYVQELESIAAASIMLDAQVILAKDWAIVQAADHANNISRIVYVCCRYCYGVEHKYQWRDLGEYLEACSAVIERNEERATRKVRLLPDPDDSGGFGYDSSVEPNATCPRCEGMGARREIFADTTQLGPAQALYLGLEVDGKGRTKILMHDVDKAKERLLRAGGVFKDDAASVARGAAAGAAMGAAAAAAAQRVVSGEPMTAEQAQRLYLELAG